MLKLLQRTPIKHGEWWEGYVARTLLDNGCPSNGKYLLGKLEPLVAAMVSEEVKLDTQAGEALGKGVGSFQQYKLPTWAVRGYGAAAAHCPDCFREDPFVRLSWRLPAVTHCEAHDRPLQIRCGGCRRLVFHWDLARQSCRCGAPISGPTSGPSLSEMAPVAKQGVSAADGQRERWIFSAQQAESYLSIADGSSRPGPSPIVLMTFVGHLLSYLMAGRQRGKSTEKRPIGGLLMQLGTPATPSLSWLEELWPALPSTAYLRRALNLVLSLHHAERSAPSEMGSLPLWNWAETLCSLGASPASAERRGWVPVGALKPGLVSATSAAKLAGVQVNYFLDLMAKGLARPV
ncbi:MAG: TniQ family protein, partial [Burkholderiaceae bacterium]|nr:TniQ family protein [Burkholderiaceae bacterium]